MEATTGVAEAVGIGVLVSVAVGEDVAVIVAVGVGVRLGPGVRVGVCVGGIRGSSRVVGMTTSSSRTGR
jgi:hypothetical protein